MMLRRRLLGVLLASITLLLMATGVPAASVPVSVLMPASFADASAGLVREFNAAHPHIRLEVTRGPLDTESVSDLAISSLLLGSSPYDLLLMDVTWTPKYVAAGWLEPLEEWIGEDALAPLAPGADLGNAFAGHLWRFPMVASMGLLYWRTDLMAAPPRTPAELEQISRQLQASGAVPWGYVWQGRQYEGLSTVFLEMLRGFGGRWIVDGSPQLDSAQAIAAANWLEGLIRQGISPPSVVTMAEPQSLQFFAAGQSAFMRNWPYAWAELNREGSELAGKVGFTTMVAAPGEPHVATQGSWGLALTKYSPHKSAAIEALQFLTSLESQTRLYEEFGYTPTRQAVFQDPALVASHPELPELEEALADAALRPLTPVYAQISDLLYRELSRVFTGRINPEQGMAQLQEQTLQLKRTVGGEL